MAIKINKCIKEQIIQDDDSILTPLYGKIKVTDTIDYNNYTYFDTVDDYDLFVSQTSGDTLAQKIESVETSQQADINKDCDLIKNKYNVEIVKYDDTLSTIIIKVSESNIDVLDKIELDFKNNSQYDIKRITPQVLFLEVKDIELQLEDNQNALDKLSDQDIKNVITKAGVKLSGSENKERLKGIMQGMLSTSK